MEQTQKITTFFQMLTAGRPFTFLSSWKPGSDSLLCNRIPGLVPHGPRIHIVSQNGCVESSGGLSECDRGRNRRMLNTHSGFFQRLTPEPGRENAPGSMLGDTCDSAVVSATPEMIPDKVMSEAPNDAGQGRQIYELTAERDQLLKELERLRNLTTLTSKAADVLGGVAQGRPSIPGFIEYGSFHKGTGAMGNALPRFAELSAIRTL
jgi:hypothetical protein